MKKKKKKNIGSVLPCDQKTQRAKTFCILLAFDCFGCVPRRLPLDT